MLLLHNEEGVSNALGQHVALRFAKCPSACSFAWLGPRMYAGRTVSQSALIVQSAFPTAYRKLIHAFTSRAGLRMLAQDLSTFGRWSCLYERQAACHFGRPRYCVPSCLTLRSLAVRADPGLGSASTRLSVASTASTRSRHPHKIHTRAAASTVDKVTEASSSQPTPPKFSKRTCVKDVKVSML